MTVDKLYSTEDGTINSVLFPDFKLDLNELFDEKEPATEEK